ncbi:hypothetical protein CF54_03935 [Streptomyces sp. Tu 6176]|uniref:hypothetical protein n=1 Tax=Streptomyces sp. Tu 6176 TaxID=1470557 RepID=UPI00044A736B|nr:hypothetical protein [Streptomyces sp. Tu 6176]EYT84024.1 hypothetical protein CF54_03935 [Streptomyces sp. Tu 6176]
MRGPARRAARRLGLLGAGLLITGILWINWGLGLVLDPRFGTVRAATALTALAPIHVWGWTWITAGALSCAGALLPDRRTWIGLIPAAGMPAIWSAAYVLARAVGEFPQGFNSGLTWLGYPALLALLAAAARRVLEEHRRRRHLETEVEHLRLTAASTARGGE